MDNLALYVQENYDTLCKRLSRSIRNVADRDDIIQETTIAILQAAPTLSESELPRYFTRAMYSKVARYLNNTDDVAVLSGFVEKEECPVSNPLHELMDAENSYLVPDLIREKVKNEKQQVALELIYCEGCAPQVAADIVGISRGAVDTANYRFKKEVKGIFEGMRR